MYNKFFMGFLTRIESEDMELLNKCLQKNEIRTHFYPFDGDKALIYVEEERYVRAINLGVKFILDNELYGDIDVYSPLGTAIYYNKNMKKDIESNLVNIFGDKDLKTKKEDLEYDDERLVC